MHFLHPTIKSDVEELRKNAAYQHSETSKSSRENHEVPDSVSIKAVHPATKVKS